MASLNAKMALRPACAIASLLLVLLLLACKLNLASGSSGGVMGGNFFDSDSSSSSESSMIDSEPLHRREEEAHSSPADADGLGWGTHGGVLMFLIFIFGVFFVGFCKDTDANTITLCKLQVAMFGGSKGSSIQRDLTRIAKAADTSSREGVSHLLTETIQALDRHPSYSIAGYSSVGQKQSMEDGKKCYDQLSNEERGKFDKETLVNLFNVEKRSQSINEFINEDTSLNVKESTTESQKFEEEELLNGLGDEYIVVAVFGGNTGSSVQSDLTRIAKAADTSSREGVSHLLIETIEALDRQPSSLIAGYSSVDLMKDREGVKKYFNQLSNEERGKFDEVTLVKRSSVNVFSNEDTLWNAKESINVPQKLEEELLNGSGNEYIALDIKESADESQKFEEEELLKVFGNEYIVVTILVAAKGAHKLPNNNGAEDLKKALQKLRSILLLPSKLLAGEVLWTPQKEDESLPGRKLLKDYPHLVESMKSFRVKKEE